MMIEYPVRFDPEDGGFVVQGLPPLTGVITEGDALDEAKAMAREALTGVLEVMLDHGEPIPRPPEHFEERGVYWISPDAHVITAILLRFAREDAHLTQAELASRLGVTYQAVQRLERSGSNPSVKTLAKVAKALGRELKIAI